MAQASPVELRNEEPGCWMESTDEGWLFLALVETTKGEIVDAADQKRLLRNRLNELEAVDLGPGELVEAGEMDIALKAQSEVQE
jgi:hypothetical protein